MALVSHCQKLCEIMTASPLALEKGAKSMTCFWRNRYKTLASKTSVDKSDSGRAEEAQKNPKDG